MDKEIYFTELARKFNSNPNNPELNPIEKVMVKRIAEIEKNISEYNEQISSCLKDISNLDRKIIELQGKISSEQGKSNGIQETLFNLKSLENM